MEARGSSWKGDEMRGVRCGEIAPVGVKDVGHPLDGHLRNGGRNQRPCVCRVAGRGAQGCVGSVGESDAGAQGCVGSVIARATSVRKGVLVQL